MGQEFVNSSAGWFSVSVSYNFAVRMSAWTAVIWKLVSSWRLYFQALLCVDRKPQSIRWLVGWRPQFLAMWTSPQGSSQHGSGSPSKWIIQEKVFFKMIHPRKRENKVKAYLFMTQSLKSHTITFTVFFYHKWMTKSILPSKSREAKREQKQSSWRLV